MKMADDDTQIQIQINQIEYSITYLCPEFTFLFFEIFP